MKKLIDLPDEVLKTLAIRAIEHGFRDPKNYIEHLCKLDAGFSQKSEKKAQKRGKKAQKSDIKKGENLGEMINLIGEKQEKTQNEKNCASTIYIEDKDIYIEDNSIYIEEKEKKEKKEKNNSVNKTLTKKIFTPPTQDEVVNYFMQNGYSSESGAKAWNYYEVGKWSDGRGVKIINWKQKMISVWFKNENKAILTHQNTQDDTKYHKSNSTQGIGQFGRISTDAAKAFIGRQTFGSNNDRGRDDTSLDGVGC